MYSLKVVMKVELKKGYNIYYVSECVEVKF